MIWLCFPAQPEVGCTWRQPFLLINKSYLFTGGAVGSCPSQRGCNV